MRKIGMNEEAVSPVIGVILMVAITVILAAVIAAFVFGMAGGVAKTKNVAATVSRGIPTAATPPVTTFTFTYQGGTDSGLVKLLAATVDGTAATEASGVTGWVATDTTPPAVGSSATNAYSSAPTKAHCVVTATFTDGSSQVILDTMA